jgi:hypothetical protein
MLNSRFRVEALAHAIVGNIVVVLVSTCHTAVLHRLDARIYLDAVLSVAWQCCSECMVVVVPCIRIGTQQPHLSVWDVDCGTGHTFLLQGFSFCVWAASMRVVNQVHILTTNPSHFVSMFQRCIWMCPDDSVCVLGFGCCVVHASRCMWLLTIQA